MEWHELVALMAVGDGREHTLRGVVLVRDLDEVERDEPFDVELEGERFRKREGRVRVSARGDRLRVESLQGEPQLIRSSDDLWSWEGAGGPPVHREGLFAWRTDVDGLVRRRELHDWQGDDYTRPAGPPEEVTFLGRRAWRIELLPPPHKPFPLTWVVDAETGLLLSERNEGAGVVTEWLELEVDGALPADCFTWHGPTREPDRWQDARSAARTGASITLHGGGRDEEALSACLQPFVTAVRGRSERPRIAVVWVDEGDGTDWGARLAEPLARLLDHERVDVRVALGEPLDPLALQGIDGIAVCPGLTPAYAEALAPAADTIRELVLERGVPYVGSSAGAAVAARQAVVGGWRVDGQPVCPEDAGEDLDEVTVVAGLGLVEETVEVHASQWGTLGRLRAALDEGAEGLGLDEGTAWVVADGEARVVGTGAVHLLRHRGGGDVAWQARRSD